MILDANAIRRRRECENWYSIYDVREVSPLIVVKKMELENNFREKILNGLVRSCEKRPVRYQQLEDITNKVEWQLRDSGQTEISSRILVNML